MTEKIRIHLEDVIRKKRFSWELTEEEIHAFVAGIVDGSLRITRFPRC